MTLRIRFDHRIERLADALLDALDHAPADPLAERTVIVPSVGVGRWLQRRDAGRHGVSARLRTEFAGRWLWRTMRAAMPDLAEQSPFEPERVRWALMALLGELPDAPDFALLRERVRGEGSLARLSLADALARVFERYLVYRRDWLANWQRGQWASGARALAAHEVWQRWLWQRLLERLPGIGREHPYDRFVRLLADDRGQLRRAFGMQSVALFGRIDLSPEQFALIGQLSMSIDVSVFAPDPCRELWTDMLDARRLAALREQRPDLAWLYEGEPVLLGNWGRAQRDFVAQVLLLEERFGVQAEAPGREEATPFGAHGDAAPAGTLQRLQAAVFLRSDAPWRQAGDDDGSIAVLGAHGFVRQAEVLHERLLECFEVMPGLGPADVVVFCADLEAAAGAIEGVFHSQPEGRRIPVVISGRAARADLLVTAVADLLSMAVRGITAPALDECLRNPAMMEALGLEPAQVETLLGWFDAAGARRGLDAEDGSPKHDLRSAIDRLLLGAAIGAAEPLGDLLAVPGAQGTRARILESWLPVGDALAALRVAARSPRPLADWCTVFGDAVETLFGHVWRHEAGLHRVRDALAALLASAADMPAVALDAAAFERVFLDALARGAVAALPTGAVTVCPIGSLPGVPFRVVCLFGMDEGAFPRRGAADELDLMRRAPRFGDRLARIDERGVFLDAVLAAMERLVVLCRSRNARDDTPLNPSPLVAELLAYLAAQTAGPDLADASCELARRRYPERTGPAALVEYPLHPFSTRGFTGPGSYAREWFACARALAQPLRARAPGIGALADVVAPGDAASGDNERESGVREKNDAREDGARDDGAPARVARDEPAIAIETLRDALAGPAATWLRETIGMRLPREPSAPDDTEPLWIDEDDRALVQHCVERLLAGEDARRIADELALAPPMAAGAPGRCHAASIVQRAGALIDEVAGEDSAVPRAAGPGADGARGADPVVAVGAGIRLTI
ncbi:MAG: exodeoxyribonuclease V subunit gamma, partial [Burkholderiaceae bacterium]|nr:exodeoxyribonuclease V subunit gamma [Burkholderiaceae bacterium]